MVSLTWSDCMFGIGGGIVVTGARANPWEGA